MHVLITGGAGFIGSHVADCLLGAGHTVRALDNLCLQVHPDGRRPAYLDEQIELFASRLLNNQPPLIFEHRRQHRDFYSLRDAVCEAETVFHLAAEHSAGPGRLPPEFETNLRGTLNLLEAVRSIQPPPVLVTASAARARAPTDLYYASRAAADRYVQIYARTFDLRAVVLRFGSVYGLRAPGGDVETRRRRERWRPRPLDEWLSDITRQLLAADVPTTNHNGFEKGGNRARSRG